VGKSYRMLKTPAMRRQEWTWSSFIEPHGGRIRRPRGRSGAGAARELDYRGVNSEMDVEAAGRAPPGWS
jgi:hypothetical protein